MALDRLERAIWLGMAEGRVEEGMTGWLDEFVRGCAACSAEKRDESN